MLKNTVGFTLIELLITMVILAIIATVAVPNFGNLIESNRLTSGTNLLVSSIKLARAEAIKRGDNVTFSTGGDMSNGWCIHTGNASGNCANNQIRSFESPGNLVFNESVSDLVFDRRGFLTPQTAQNFTVFPNGCVTGDASFRTINVSAVGRTVITDGVCP